MDLPNNKTYSPDGMSVLISDASTGFWERITITALQINPDNNELRIA